jgi:hypothetical protein
MRVIGSITIFLPPSQTLEELEKRFEQFTIFEPVVAFLF